MRSNYSYFNEPFGRSYEPDFETIPEFQSAVEPSNLQQAAVISSPQTYESATIQSAPTTQTAAQTGRTEDPDAIVRDIPRPYHKTGENPNAQSPDIQSQPTKDNTMLYAGIGVGMLLLIIVLVVVLKKKK